MTRKTNQTEMFPARGPPRGELTGRTITIKNMVDRELARSGRRPTVEEIAKLLATSTARVEHHYRLLGFLT